MMDSRGFALLLLAAVAGCKPSVAMGDPVAPGVPVPQTPAPELARRSSKVYAQASEGELRARLTRLQFEVTQHEATEPPFHNEFWDNHAAGIYVDVATGEPLFSSADKFESGTGWPSFTRPIEADRVVTHDDSSLGFERVEVRSRAGRSHLGHVFDDGPPPGGMRYCINSAALRFIPADRLVAEGYGAYASRFSSAVASAPVPDATNNACAMPPPGERPGCEATLETAVLEGAPAPRKGFDPAGALRNLTGVLDAEPEGRGRQVRVTYDPKRIALADLVDRWVALGGRRSAP